MSSFEYFLIVFLIVMILQNSWELWNIRQALGRLENANLKSNKPSGKTKEDESK